MIAKTKAVASPAINDIFTDVTTRINNINAKIITAKPTSEKINVRYYIRIIIVWITG